MTNWITMQYINGYGKTLTHTCSIQGIKDIKAVMERYNIRNEDVTGLIVNGEVKDITKVRESLR